MGCGRLKVYCIALSLFVLPGMVRADFVHVGPVSGSRTDNGSLVPQSGDSASARLVDSIVPPREIATSSDNSWVAPPAAGFDAERLSASEEVAATLSKIPPLQLPPDGAAKGIRPLVLNDAVNPTVPEPTIPVLATFSLTCLLARRRREVPANAGLA
jgi:hypothetical protein